MGTRFPHSLRPLFSKPDVPDLPALNYPTTKTIQQSDDYFGVAVEDPYRWLEKDARSSKEVAAWVEQQNKLAFGYIKQLPYRDEIERRLTKLWDFEKYSAPFRRGDRYYFQKNDGLQNQYVLYVMDSLDAEPKVLIDPNTCLLYTSPSPRDRTRSRMPSSA